MATQSNPRPVEEWAIFACYEHQAHPERHFPTKLCVVCEPFVDAFRAYAAQVQQEEREAWAIYFEKLAQEIRQEAKVERQDGADKTADKWDESANTYERAAAAIRGRT